MGNASDSTSGARRHPMRARNNPAQREGIDRMPRYIVERAFPERLQVPSSDEGARAVQDIVARNADFGVTWIHSYVSEDRKKTFCLYDAPSPEAIRRAAAANGLPVDRIVAVRVLDPYFYLYVPAGESAEV